MRSLLEPNTRLYFHVVLKWYFDSFRHCIVRAWKMQIINLLAASNSTYYA